MMARGVRQYQEKADSPQRTPFDKSRTDQVTQRESQAIGRLLLATKFWFKTILLIL